MRQIMKTCAIAVIFVFMAGVAWSNENAKYSFFDDLGKTATEIMAIYGTPRLGYNEEEPVLRFAYKDVPLQGRFYNVNYYILGHRAVGLNYYISHTPPAVTQGGPVQWYDAYMGKSVREILDAFGLPDNLGLAFPDSFIGMLEYKSLNFEGCKYYVQFAFEDDAVFGISYGFRDTMPVSEMQAYVMGYDARIMQALDEPAWVLWDSSWNPHQPSDKHRLFEHLMASKVYNASLHAVEHPNADMLIFDMTFHDRTASGAYAQEVIAEDDKWLRYFLGKEAEMRELAQINDDLKWVMDFDWSQTRGNIEKLATLPNYTEIGPEP